jgi:hypothetical protein
MIRFFLIILLSISINSCKKVDKFTQFNIDYTVNLAFNSGVPINVPIDILIPPKETNSSATFEANDTRKDKIEQINLTKMYLQITSPPNEDFSFLDEVEIYIKANGLSEISLAFKKDISNSTGNYLELTVNGNDFKEYIKKDSFEIRVRAVFDEQVLNDINVKCFMQFFVDAKILGV